MSIGETLVRARGRAGLTVATVSERTRIREGIIRAIEHDDFSSCGGDFYARGHIRSIAHAVGTDPEPLIWEYDHSHGEPEAVTAPDAFEPLRPVKIRERRGVNWTSVLALALVVAVGVAGYYLLFRSSGTSSPAPPSHAHAVVNHHASQGTTPSPGHRASPSPTAARPATPVPSRTLSPVSVTAFGPSGPGQGDNPQLAHLAIDGNPGTAWHSDWYATARFGNLQRGTGLLLNMGHPVTITAVRITLAAGSGASLQVRTGDTPSLAGLDTVAHANGARGSVHMLLSTPAHGRYLLIWFTRLPQDPSGTFQAGVSGIRVTGRG